MIALVYGKVVEKFVSSIVIDTGGVGYEIEVAAGDYDNVQVGADAKFYTYHQVRENAEELFGFSSLAMKRLFELLITVQGVGPKAAMAILSLADSETVRGAIANSDAHFVATASGVGKKTAERVVLDLHDKVGVATTSTAMPAVAHDEALDALMALGFKLADATTALAKVPQDLPTAERVKLALKEK